MKSSVLSNSSPLRCGNVNKYLIKGQKIEARTYADAARIALQDPDAMICSYPCSGALWLTTHRGHATLYYVPEHQKVAPSQSESTVIFRIIALRERRK